MINVKDLNQFQRFLNLCATRIGQTLDYTHMANDLGLSRHTIREWLSILKASFIISTLPPYFENLGKRITKSSKLYFNDVGLVCYLLNIRDVKHIAHHPLRGSLFENLLINEITKLHINKGHEPRLYFYRDSNQLEVDVVFQQGLELIAIEIKSSKTFHPSFLKGLKAFQKLATTYQVRPYLIYSGDHEQVVQTCHVINYNHVECILDAAS